MSDRDDKLEDLRKLGDEIRGKLRDAGAQAKEQWKKLEPRLLELEKRAEKGGEKFVAATEGVAREVGRGLRDLARRLSRGDNG